MLAVLVASAGVAGDARAQSDAPDGGGFDLSATVPSELGLFIGTPSAFARGKAANAYQMSIPASVTSTEVLTTLSIADGDDPSGPGHGHLRAGSKTVAAPLEVGTAGGALQSLATPFDPLLETWKQPLLESPSTIAVRQHVTMGSISPSAAHKVLLVTVSIERP